VSERPAKSLAGLVLAVPAKSLAGLDLTVCRLSLEAAESGAEWEEAAWWSGQMEV